MHFRLKISSYCNGLHLPRWVLKEVGKRNDTNSNKMFDITLVTKVIQMAIDAALMF